MHDNSYLGDHGLQSLSDTDAAPMNIAALKKKLHDEASMRLREQGGEYSEAAAAARRQQETEALQVVLDDAAGVGRDRALQLAAAEQAELQAAAEARGEPGYTGVGADEVDLVAAESDRTVLAARVRELRSCSDILRRLALRFGEEQTHCAEATKAAEDAIHRRFDVLRQLLDHKEKAFVALVHNAAQQRHAAGFEQRTAIAAAVAETDGFTEQMTTQLRRFEGNARAFAAASGGLLADTKRRLGVVDDAIHNYETTLREVSAMPLGCSVPIDHISASIQALEPPPHLQTAVETSRDVSAVASVSRIPASRFQAEAGVKQFRADGTFVGRGLPGGANTMAGPSSGAIATTTTMVVSATRGAAASGGSGFGTPLRSTSPAPSIAASATPGAGTSVVARRALTQATASAQRQRRGPSPVTAPERQLHATTARMTHVPRAYGGTATNPAAAGGRATPTMRSASSVTSAGYNTPRRTTTGAPSAAGGAGTSFIAQQSGARRTATTTTTYSTTAGGAYYYGSDGGAAAEEQQPEYFDPHNSSATASAHSRGLGAVYQRTFPLEVRALRDHVEGRQNLGAGGGGWNDVRTTRARTPQRRGPSVGASVSRW
jgi:hypothetical protein